MNKIAPIKINRRTLHPIYIGLILIFTLFGGSLSAEEIPDLDQGVNQLANSLSSQIVEKIEKGEIKSNTRTAVMDILEADTNRRLELSNYLETGLMNEFVKSSQLDILDREKTLQARDILEKPIREIAGTPLIPRGVDFVYVVTGKFSVIGDRCQITIQLIAIQNAQIMASAQTNVKTGSIDAKLLGLAGISVAEQELAHLKRVDAAEAKGDQERMLELLEEFLMKFPDSLRKLEVQGRIDDLKSANSAADEKIRAAELLMVQPGLEQQAIKYLKSVIQDYPKSPAAITATGLLITLDLMMDIGEALEKSYSFEAQYSKHPVLVKLKAARDQFQEREKKKKQSGKANILLAEGMELYKNDQIFNAREKLQAVVFNFPDTEEAKEAKSQLDLMDQEEAKANEILAVAKILINSPQTHQLARIELVKIKDSFPKTIANVEALGYLIILDFKEQKDVSRDAAYFLVKYPNHQLVPEIKKHQQTFLKVTAPKEPGAEQLDVAKKMLKNGLLDEGLKILAGLAMDYPKSPVGIEATGLIILSNLQKCQYSEVDIVQYTTLNRDSPLSVSILEAQNKALKSCKLEDLAPKIEGMVFIKGGEVKVGIPLQTIALDPYYIDIHEVTNEKYLKCVDSGYCKRSLYIEDDRFNGPSHPVVGVSWKSADNYCQSVGKRLPGEYEWEWAAVGAQFEKPYPDKSILPAIAHYKDNTSYQNPTQKIGIKDPNGIGIYDMIGNVSEWVADWYSIQYYSNIPYQNPKGPESGSKRVHRGGNWSSADNLLLPLNRSFDYESKMRNTLGFRCVKDYTPNK
ncbi:SUMF1/EgtB/PvdO family nonheme iron enzyme [bacterium]|nr:SUMF1/EgtB/PvdO family nonheme iron enzyme [bacterium]